MTYNRAKYGGVLGLHNCDSGRGASGSPMSTLTRASFRVVGIHRGGWYFKKAKLFRFGPGRSVRLKRTNSAVLPTELRRNLKPFLAMKFINKRMSVSDRQTRLKKAGIFNGKIDDEVTPRLTRAIARFQLNYNLVPQGIPTLATIMKLP